MIKDTNIIFYVVSILHIRNLDILYKFIFKKKKIKITVLYEQSLNLIDTKSLNKDFEFYNVDKLDLNLFLKNKQISFAIMCTSQSRVAPFLISYNCFAYNIPVICLQETNQAFLHNKEFNNYVLPADYFLGISKFETDYIKSLTTNLNTVVAGWPYNLEYLNKNSYNHIKKKKFLFNLNASNIINNFSLENVKKLSILISQLIKKIGIDDLYIKFHPAEDKSFIKTIKKKFNNDLFLDNKKKIIDYSFCYETLISTGFSQSIIESIIDGKNIILIKLENKGYLIEKYNNVKILNYNQIMDFNFNSFNKKNINYSDLLKDHIPFLDYDSLKVLENFFTTPKKNNKSKIKLFEYYLWNEFISIINNNKPIESIDIKSDKYYNDFKNFYNFKHFNTIKFSKFINSFSNLTTKDLIISVFIYKSLYHNKILFDGNHDFLNLYPYSKNKNLFIYFINLFYNNKKLNYNKQYHKMFINSLYMNRSIFFKIKKFLKNLLF